MTEHPFIISSSNKSHRLLWKRRMSELRFRFFGSVAIFISIGFLAFLLFTIFSNGFSAFIQTKIRISVDVSKYVDLKEVKKDDGVLKTLSYRQIVNDSLRKIFPKAKRRDEVIQLFSLISRSSYIDAQKQIEKEFISRKKFKNKPVDLWLPSSSLIDQYVKGNIKFDENNLSAKISKIQAQYVKDLKEEGRLGKFFNTKFFTSGDSREPEIAGILGALVGSVFVMVSCMLLAVPLGVAAATYLEEFAPKNRLTTLIELSINNLAAVPSIVYGLLGLAIFLNFFELPRSSALAGGLTLALLVLPVMVVATRNSLASVPPSIRDAARGLGASKMQVVFHHVLPLATPGIMTGAILSMARALGETAPLLMIGMVAFISDIPKNFMDPATVLPVQVYIWSDMPEAGFVEKTSAAIIMLLIFLILANALAVYLRKKFEVKW